MEKKISDLELRKGLEDVSKIENEIKQINGINIGKITKYFIPKLMKQKSPTQ